MKHFKTRQLSLRLVDVFSGPIELMQNAIQVKRRNLFRTSKVPKRLGASDYAGATYDASDNYLLTPNAVCTRLIMISVVNIALIRETLIIKTAFPTRLSPNYHFASRHTVRKLSEAIEKPRPSANCIFHLKWYPATGRWV